MRLGLFEFSPSWIPSVITVLMLTLLVSLGIWQLERAAAKAQLTGDFESGAQDAPIVIDGSLTHADGLRFRLAVAEGAYDGGRQFLLSADRI